MPSKTAARRLWVTFWHSSAIFMEGTGRSVMMDTFSQLVHMDTHWEPATLGMLKAENNNGIKLLQTVLKYLVNLSQPQLRSVKIEGLLDMGLEAVPYVYDSREGIAPWIAFGAHVVTV